MPAVERSGSVVQLHLGDGENRFGLSWLAEVNEVLDEITSSEEPAALVTYGTGKFYSNGLDLEWMMANGAQIPCYSADVQALLARVLTLPVPTIAAINGHAFGAGAMLAMAHDFRIMRTDRGYFCFPEVDIDIPFTPGMSALIQSKLTPAAATASMTTGRRFGGAEAAAAGLVDDVVDAEGLVVAATNRIGVLTGKNPRVLGQIKATMHREAAELLANAAV
jgi:enoyl-CoA hydratase/carnithine racemase